jgi:hypothetical protein
MKEYVFIIDKHLIIDNIDKEHLSYLKLNIKIIVF